MTKLTLDEVEYDTEDFSEDQNKILNELIANKNVKRLGKLQVRLRNVSGMIQRYHLKTFCWS